MKLFEKLKGITGDLMYSMLGLIAMNGVIQLVLYPALSRHMGAERFGVALTLLSLVAIMGSTFGTAANYSRMVSYTQKRDSNGDYNIFLLIITGLCGVVSVIGAVWLDQMNLYFVIGYFLLMAVTVLRYYSDVEFRLRLNYRRFFVFYLLISVGYLAGVVAYSFTKSWVVTMLIGEVLAVGFVVCTGHIYKRPLFKPSQYFKENMKSLILLSGTELIAALVLNADRMLLQVFAGGVAVTVFYAATLIGKMVSLVSMPLNGVIMGHLTRYNGKLSSKTFTKICAGSLGLAVVLDFVCVAVSYIFVKIMYPDIFDMVVPYFWLANAGQILYFLSNTLTVVLLRFTEEKYQLYINIIYLIVFIAAAIPMTYVWKLWGMAWALFIVNIVKIIVIAIVGKKKLA